MSYDEGKSWPVEKTLHAGPTAYSCLTILSDDTMGCLYEAGKSNSYETITFARFSLAWLTDGADSPARRRLKLKRAGSSVSLSWPAAFSNGVVEFCEHIGSSAPWLALAETPKLIDGFWKSTAPIGSTQRFFRLKIPDTLIPEQIHPCLKIKL